MYRITIHHSFMYKEAQQHRAVLPAIARHLVYCIALQFVSMCWVCFHSPVCTSMRRHSSSRWRESSSKACCSLQFNVSASRLWRPLLLLRVLSPSCASMCRRARPCGSMRAHASFSGTPFPGYTIVFHNKFAIDYNITLHWYLTSGSKWTGPIR